MHHPGWLLVIVGLIIAGIGVVWILAPSTAMNRTFGREDSAEVMLADASTIRIGNSRIIMIGLSRELS